MQLKSLLQRIFISDFISANNSYMSKDSFILRLLWFPLTRFAGIIAIILILFSSCSEPMVEKPGMPLVYLDFNGNVSNTGLLKVSIRGDGNVSYCTGISDSCLDLSVTSRFRKPVVIEKSSLNSLNDYPGITFLLWTKSDNSDPYEYFIFGQKDYFEEMGIKGWSIGKSTQGSWTWWFSDGVNSVNYSPTHKRQPINDDSWHLVGFSIDYSQKEARLFYDGLNVAIISLENMDLTSKGTPFYLGSDPLASDPLMDTYNGKIDEVGIWSRALTSAQVAALYSERVKFKSPVIKKVPDSLKVLTWNIWLGGRRDGRFVGVQRVADIIRESGADVVAIQEMFGSGELLADQLGFYYYQRSSGIGVLSRFPMGRTYNVYRPQNAGAVSIELPNNRQIVFCPVWLNYLPNTRAYVSSGRAESDTIIAREMETRGTEMRYILWELQSLINNKDNVPIIMAGDFNSGSHLDWTKANRDNNYGLVVEFPVSKFIQDAGFIDSFREMYPNEIKFRGHTWPLNLRHGFQDRTDFVYYTGNKLEILSCDIINSYPNGFPSDHAAVISSFKLK